MSSAADPVASQVIALVARKFNADARVLSRVTDLERDLGADSLDMVELLILLESEFAIDIPDEDAEGITTVQQVIDYLTENGTRCNCLECRLQEVRGHRANGRH